MIADFAVSLLCVLMSFAAIGLTNRVKYKSAAFLLISAGIITFVYDWGVPV